MSKITVLKKSKPRAKRINVYVDDRLALTLTPETVKKEKLKTGVELDEAALKELAEKDLARQCFNAAARFLGYRPRSESEIRRRLKQHGFEDKIIEKTLARLRENGFTDDDAFARFWVENRELFSPRGRRLAKMELKRKGLAPEIIEKAIGMIDEKDSAYRAAQKKAPRLAALDRTEFRLRLGAYLGRRGFGYAVIKETTEKAWKELRKK